MAKAWIALAVLVVGFVAVANWMGQGPQKPDRVDIKVPTDRKANLGKASMSPGKVIELDTAKGKIQFVLFEKDCPVTARKIGMLVDEGRYDNVAFSRVEKSGLIQTALPKGKLGRLKLEALKGLENVKGAVGMARVGDDLSSGTGSFYILSEPWRHLDYDYCVFGRVISGMDVVEKIKRGDKIRKATLRPLTPEDRKLYNRALQLEVERETS